MKRLAKRSLTTIDASSTADIAFLLLVFFLVTANMASDIGIQRKLPPLTDAEPGKQRERNVLEVWVNANGSLLVEGKPFEIAQLRERTMAHILNADNLPNYPERSFVSEATIQAEITQKTNLDAQHPSLPKLERQLLATRLIGSHYETDQLVSLKADRKTPYHNYIAIQDALAGGYKDARNSFSMQHFGKPLEQLKPEEFEAVRTAIPQHISEAEPNE